jgi:hypothetical protein
VSARGFKGGEHGCCECLSFPATLSIDCGEPVEANNWDY